MIETEISRKWNESEIKIWNLSENEIEIKVSWKWNSRNVGFFKSS